MNNKPLTYYVILVSMFTTFAIMGCAQNKPKQPEIKEVFTTHIDADDTKLFVYKISMENQDRSRKGGKDGRSEGRKGKGGGGKEGGRPGRNGSREGGKGRDEGENKNEERMRALLDARLNSMIKTTGYCVEGYDVIDEAIFSRTATVNAQCINKATPEDRERFPNRVEQTTVIEEDLGAL